MISRKKLAQLVSDTQGTAKLDRVLPGPQPKTRANTKKVRGPQPKGPLPKTENQRRWFGKVCRTCNVKQPMGFLKRVRIRGKKKQDEWQCLEPCTPTP